MRSIGKYGGVWVDQLQSLHTYNEEDVTGMSIANVERSRLIWTRYQNLAVVSWHLTSLRYR